jgi:hypothetical protein
MCVGVYMCVCGCVNYQGPTEFFGIFNTGNIVRKCFDGDAAWDACWALKYFLTILPVLNIPKKMVYFQKYILMVMLLGIITHFRLLW